jgi:hypothetical protein
MGHACFSKGVRLFFDVEGAKLVTVPLCGKSRHCSCFMVSSASITRSTSPPTRPWRMLLKPTISIIEKMLPQNPDDLLF